MVFDPAITQNPKYKLEHTFDAFLARFGRLTAIQELALDPLLRGENCVLAAATASGKTEAALVPLLERYQQQRFKTNSRKTTPTIKFLYIVPTRALARDIARRVEQPLKKMAIGLAVKTGDDAALSPSRPPEFLITTPESLDSLLANRPKMLRDVRGVVLDELHLYDNTPRGDQLRILLNRLRRLRQYAYKQGDSKSAEVQFCALSATMSDPARIAAKYFSNPVLIQTAGQRTIDAQLFEMEGVGSLLELIAAFNENEIKKVLAFCQKRAECEEWVSLLRGKTAFGDEVLVHHANLSAHIRRQTEEKFAGTGAALCFATSTLELGIDIGDVDLVLLIGAPDNLGSFLQRIGRGNRRTRRTMVACFYRTPLEEALFRVFIRAAKDSDAETEALLAADNGLAFRPSVVVQQLCSYLKQTTYSVLDPEHAYGLFTTPGGESLIEKNQYDRIVEYLVEKDFLRPAMAGGRQLQAGEIWEKLYEERTLYSNMSGINESSVVIDNLTGRLVGYLDSRMPKDSVFLMGGHALRVTATKGRKILTKAETGKASVRKPYQKWNRRVKSAALTKALAVELDFPIAGETGAMPQIEVQPETETEEMPPEGEMQDEDGTGIRTLLFHNSGEVYGQVLSDLLEKGKNLPILEHDEFFIEIAAVLSETDLKFTDDEIRNSLSRQWKSLESSFDLGRFQNDLPPEVRRSSVTGAFNLPKFKQLFSTPGTPDSR